jgi:hypothetical protein
MNNNFPADPVRRTQQWRRHRAWNNQHADESRLPGRRSSRDPGLGFREVWSSVRAPWPPSGNALPTTSVRDPRDTNRNPKGIPAQCPGLRGTSYPGKQSQECINPEGVGAASGGPKGRGRNPFRVEPGRRYAPRVARPLQPWAGGHNPFGMENGRKGTEPRRFKRIAPQVEPGPQADAFSSANSKIQN